MTQAQRHLKWPRIEWETTCGHYMYHLKSFIWCYLFDRRSDVWRQGHCVCKEDAHYLLSRALHCLFVCSKLFWHISEQDVPILNVQLFHRHASISVAAWAFILFWFVTDGWTGFLLGKASLPRNFIVLQTKQLTVSRSLINRVML